VLIKCLNPKPYRNMNQAFHQHYIKAVAAWDFVMFLGLTHLPPLVSESHIFSALLSIEEIKQLHKG